MRIEASDYYKARIGKVCDCGLYDCERFYCSGKTHRLLFRMCESVTGAGGERAGWEDGGSKTWVEYSGDCPQCHEEYQRHKYEEWAKERERHESNA
jgi:hypothetical protein